MPSATDQSPRRDVRGRFRPRDSPDRSREPPGPTRRRGGGSLPASAGVPACRCARSASSVAAVGVILTALLIALVYRREFLTSEHLPAVATIPARHHRPLVIKSV